MFKNLEHFCLSVLSWLSGWNSQNACHSRQTGQTLIRLLLQKQSDHGLCCMSMIFRQATHEGLKFLNIYLSNYRYFA